MSQDNVPQTSASNDMQTKSRQTKVRQNAKEAMVSVRIEKHIECSAKSSNSTDEYLFQFSSMKCTELMRSYYLIVTIGFRFVIDRMAISKYHVRI